MAGAIFIVICVIALIYYDKIRISRSYRQIKDIRDPDIVGDLWMAGMISIDVYIEWHKDHAKRNNDIRADQAKQRLKERGYEVHSKGK